MKLVQYNGMQACINKINISEKQNDDKITKKSPLINKNSYKLVQETH